MDIEPKLIGITGYARHGKGTVAKILEKHGYTVLSFADPVRQFLLALNPLIETYTFEPEPQHRGVRLSVLIAQYGWQGAKEKFKDVRTLLQRLGTEAAKPIFGNDCWAEIGMLKAGEIIARGGKVCFDDVRFPMEEGEAILNPCFVAEYVGGSPYCFPHQQQIWRVTRYNEDGTMFDNGIGADHPSESQIKNFVPDEEIRNDRSIEDLEAVICGLLNTKTETAH